MAQTTPNDAPDYEVKAEYTERDGQGCVWLSDANAPYGTLGRSFVHLFDVATYGVPSQRYIDQLVRRHENRLAIMDATPTPPPRTRAVTATEGASP